MAESVAPVSQTLTNSFNRGGSVFLMWTTETTTSAVSALTFSGYLTVKAYVFGADFRATLWSPTNPAMESNYSPLIVADTLL